MNRDKVITAFTELIKDEISLDEEVGYHHLDAIKKECSNVIEDLKSDLDDESEDDEDEDDEDEDESDEDDEPTSDDSDR